MDLMSENPTTYLQDDLKIFNRADKVVEGWYWTLPSNELKKGKVKPVKLMGREIVVYRTKDGNVVAQDAHCPHRGANFCLGHVESDGIRCQYHRWKFDESGQCVDIPIRDVPVNVKVRTWPVEDKYGMIWVWTGETPRYPVPFVPELEGQEVRTMGGGPYNKPCHPNVVMLDAIDAQHFYSVHKIDTVLNFTEVEHNENCISFTNKAPVPTRSWVGKLIDKFYKGALTFDMTYWNGSSGFVTLGPDFLHFYVMFANRIGEKGETEGRILLFTKKRKGALGYLFDKVVLAGTWIVAKYFAYGDTPVFSSINFEFKKPIKEDRPLLSFIRHTEKQECYDWR
jgi:phenylpropionate dioxygenase-like ring-hydroxylating dioxygenase large terminal subunit